MAALVGKCFVIFDGFFSHDSAATALNLKCYFDVAAFESPGFRRVFLLCNYLFALKRLSALTPASLCRQCGVPALPAGLVEREGEREGGRDASAVDKQCVRQFLTAQGMQGRRRLREEEEKLKYPLLLLFFPSVQTILLGWVFFKLFFLTHA